MKADASLGHVIGIASTGGGRTDCDGWSSSAVTGPVFVRDSKAVVQEYRNRLEAQGLALDTQRAAALIRELAGRGGRHELAWRAEARCRHYCTQWVIRFR